jgi:hypothetical protein
MSEHLSVLESAISDLGRWTWWTAKLPDSFQVEFNATQLWNSPTAEGKPPSNQIALRFRKPRLVYFLSLSDAMPEDWPDRLQRDELEPFSVDHEAFTLTKADLCAQLVAKSTSVKSLVGERDNTPLPTAEEAFLGFDSGPVGLVVAAESLGVFNHEGELDEKAVVASNQKWWAYWREYWLKKDTSAALPRDFACEVTIPLAPGS